MSKSVPPTVDNADASAKSDARAYAGTDRIREQLAKARAAQAVWKNRETRQRVAFLAKLRGLLVDRGNDLADLIRYPGRRGPAETIPAELLPLADACAFLQRRAPKLLAVETPSNRDRPIWLSGVRLELHRVSLGVVLVIGAANYPLLLAGVQILQAIVAGNAVLIKPGQAAGPLLKEFCNLLIESGVPSDLLQLLPEEPQSAQSAMSLGVDKVVLTGSAETGRDVLKQLASSLTPATLELSGCDALFVLPAADIHQVATALAFTLLFNGGGSCIAPRRVFVLRSDSERLISTLRTTIDQRLADLQSHEGTRRSIDTAHAASLASKAVEAGAKISYGTILPNASGLEGPTVLTQVRPEMELVQSDVFAPIISILAVDSMAQAVAFNNRCPYRLGATIFGNELRARSLANTVEAGCVVINDALAPTADPRAPFGGSGESGFGTTRGAAGLLEMTRLKTLIVQRKKWLPHLERPSPHDARLIHGLFAMLHGAGLWRKANGLRQMISAIICQQRAARKRDKVED